MSSSSALTIAKDPMPVAAFDSIVSAATMERLDRAAHRVSDRLSGRTLWHVNSAAEGGGVAEMLHSLVGYYLGLGLDTRWAVITAETDFFEVTKRIHNRLHGDPGDGGPLGADERAIYDGGLEANVASLRERIRPGDVVILHDPQTLGMARSFALAGAHIAWVCHVGIDDPDPLARSAWEFFGSDVGAVDGFVFSRHAYVWSTVDPALVRVIPPCIDPFAPKNSQLDPASIESILSAARLVPSDGHDVDERIRHRVDLIEDVPLMPATPLVVQVSRWDRLKDPLGVMHGFASTGRDTDAHLVLAGPAQDGVADDPEGGNVLAAVREGWRGLPAAERSRVHIALLPMQDVTENAAIVNALQRRADVVVQKSLAEGFGLTVTEAMWKERTVVASKVGGIQDQIEDGVSGVLVDPTNLSGFGASLTRTLTGSSRDGIGRRAKERVRSAYLAPHHIAAYLEMIGEITEPA